MENYIVSARKYRPSTFESVVGQRALTTTLKNAIATQKLAHAYLFCGPRGVGKTTCARIFAKTINCLNLTSDGKPCNECESCSAFNEQRSYNIHELDAASNNSVEDIRSLIDQVCIPPQIGKYKVYIIDEVHMLSQQAFNAFLKTLEEPPHHAVFILATTEKHKILPTILSRCQIYDFSRISVNDTVEHLLYVANKEGINAEPEALNVIAQKADGGMRDALSIFDQVVSFTGGDINYKSVIDNLNMLDYEYYFRLTDCLLKNDVTGSLLLFNDVLNKGFDGSHFIAGLAAHFRDVLVSRDAVTLSLLEVGAGIRERYQQQAQVCNEKFLYHAMKLCNDCDLNYRTSKNKRLLVEITLIQLAQLTLETDDPGSWRGPEQAIKPINTPQQVVQQPTTPVTVPVSVTTVSVNTATSSASVPAGNQPSVVPSSNGKATQPSVPPLPSSAEAGGTGRKNPIPAEKSEKKIPVIKTTNLGVSIKKPVQKAEEKATVVVNPSPVQTGEYQDYIFNEKDLNYYWKEFANLLPVEESAARGRMLNMQLKLLTDTIFEVVVDNEFVEKHMTSMVQQVQNYLREKLHNRKITMKIRVSESTEVVRAYSRVECFQMMSQKNPGLLKLKQELGLEFD